MSTFTKDDTIPLEANNPTIDPPAASIPSAAATFEFKKIASGWATKNATIDALNVQLANLQNMLCVLVNQGNVQSKKISTNVTALNRGKIRIPDAPGNIVLINDEINGILGKSYQYPIPELTQIQRAMELGAGVRDLEPILYFDNGREAQISARISKEVAEADELRAVLNTVIDLFTKEKTP